MLGCVFFSSSPPFKSIYLPFARKTVHTFQIRYNSMDRDFSTWERHGTATRNEGWEYVYIFLSKCLSCELVSETFFLPGTWCIQPDFMKYIRENYLKLLPIFFLLRSTYTFNVTRSSNPHVFVLPNPQINFPFVPKWWNHAFKFVTNTLTRNNSINLNSSSPSQLPNLPHA